MLEDMPVDGRKTTPDLVALRDDGHIALIECKRATSGQAKRGMFEQVLMYGEMLRNLLPEDQASRWAQQCGRASYCSSTDRLASFLPRRSPDALHVWVVVDRWSGRMDETARHTWDFMNRALVREERPAIRIWVVGGGGTPIDVAAVRAVWAASPLDEDVASGDPYAIKIG